MKLLFVAFDAAEAQIAPGFATALGAPFVVAQVTGEAAQVGAESVMSAGLGEVPTAEVLSAAVSSVATGFTHVAAVSSMRSKDVMARVAGLIDCGMVTDVVEVASPDRFVRPLLAGTVMATVEVLASPVVLTVRPAGFAGGALGANSIESWTIQVEGGPKRVGVEVRGGSRPDLTQAKVVVSGGRPLGDSATFERVIGGLADRLGGAVGATRAAVDSGIAPNELQVGQTGKIVAPDLYIAAGISGSTQHMAGIKDSKVIVAINKDPDAPIFEFADFGLVADLFDAVPELTAKAPQKN